MKREFRDDEKGKRKEISVKTCEMKIFFLGKNLKKMFSSFLYLAYISFLRLLFILSMYLSGFLIKRKNYDLVLRINNLFFLYQRKEAMLEIT